MLSFLHYRKILLWIFVLCLQFTVHGKDNKSPSLLIEASLDNRLEVRTQFPRYRVYYNPSQTAQEVLDEKKTNEVKTETEKE